MPQNFLIGKQSLLKVESNRNYTKENKRQLSVDADILKNKNYNRFDVSKDPASVFLASPPVSIVERIGRVVPPIVTNGLKVNLDASNTSSYSGAGITWIDLSSNGNNGTLVNGPTYNSAYGGNITCDGVNDYINVGATVTSFTLDIIYEPLVFDTNTGTGEYNCIIETDGGGSNKMFLRYNLNNSGQQLLLANHGGGGGPQSATVNHAVGNVYDAVITYDDTSKYTALYINSILVSSLTMTAPLLYTGTRQLGYFFNARFYNYKVYDRALSPTEVFQNYDAIRDRFGI